MSAGDDLTCPNGDPVATSGYMAIQPAGWQCPGCNRCFAPSVSKCDSCGPATYTSNGTNWSFTYLRCDKHGYLHMPGTGCPVCSGEITG